MKDYKSKENSKDVSLEGTVQTDNNALSDTVDMKVPEVSSNTNIKTVDEPKASINTKKASEAVAAGTSSSMTSVPAAFNRNGILFSGGAGQVGDDLSATTKGVSSYKSGDRTGRRQDSISRKLDLLNAEIIKPKVYESKPLAETDSKQGYNGNYQNDHAITQRVNGGHPGDPLFNRSVDEIRMDMLYHCDGQHVSKNDLNEYAIHSYNTETQSYEDDPITLKRGSFFTRSMNITVKNDGTISNIVFDTTDVSAREVDELTSRASSDAALRNINRREMDRTQMIANAGNESDPKWSPLGDAIVDSTAQNTLIADIDATCGDFLYASRRKLAQALSYQVNKTAKDGSRIVGPMAEMCNHLVANDVDAGAVNFVPEENGFNKTFHDGVVLLNGGAGLWLKVNDSIQKYNTKAKLLNLPLSFKSALNTANANIEPFRMHEQLKTVIEKNELFSTIDGPYDPLKPIVHTDSMSLITPFNINDTFSFTDGKPNFKIYTMHYENLRNKYNINICNYFVQGIYRWLNERGLRLFKAISEDMKDSANQYTIKVPVVSSSAGISLWDLIVCSAVPYMVEERIKVLTEVLKYERNFSYPYSGTVSLKDVDVCLSENFSFSSEDEALTTAIAKPIAAMKVIMPEIFWPVYNADAEAWDGSNGKGVKVVLPHYFVQNQFVYDRPSNQDDRQLLLSDDYGTMAYPSTRSGSMFGYMDTIYGMSEEDYRLSLDRMTVYPGYQGTAEYKEGGSKIAAKVGLFGGRENLPALTYKYGLTSDGQPVLTYFGWANSNGDAAKTLTVCDIIKTPRELGLLMVAPAGLLTPVKDDANNANTVNMNSSYLGLSGPGFTIVSYHSEGVDPTNDILTEGSTNITISGSLRNVWNAITANPQGSNYSKGFCFNNTIGDVSLSPVVEGSYEDNSYNFNDGTYTCNEIQHEGISLITRARYTWTRMQRLPFAINPFDANAADIKTESGAINDNDIFDFLYELGLCGFRASDYNALINERIKERIVKGMDYMNDPFIEKTTLLK